MKYYSSKTVTQILGVTAQTLRNWDKEGKRKNKTKQILEEFSKKIEILDNDIE